MDRFGEVRSLLQRAPGRKSWARLVELVSALDEEEFEATLAPYCVAHLTRHEDWYYHLRPAPPAWLARCVALGHASARFALVNELELSGLGLGPEAAVELIASSPSLSMLRVLGLAGCGLEDEHLEALLSRAALQRVEALRLGGNRLTPRGLERLLTASEALPRLELLEVQDHASLGQAAYPLLEQRLTLPKLAWINLRGCGLSGLDRRRLEASPRLPTPL